MFTVLVEIACAIVICDAIKKAWRSLRERSAAKRTARSLYGPGVTLRDIKKYGPDILKLGEKGWARHVRNERIGVLYWAPVTKPFNLSSRLTIEYLKS
jgi:hypothetical protein